LALMRASIMASTSEILWAVVRMLSRRRSARRARESKAKKQGIWRAAARASRVGVGMGSLCGASTDGSAAATMARGGEREASRLSIRDSSRTAASSSPRALSGALRGAPKPRIRTPRLMTARQSWADRGMRAVRT
jgi:hypothetical protein